MIDINLFDEGFIGHPCSVARQTPQTMRYVRGQTEWDGITVFTGRLMFDPIVGDVRSRFKVGWVTGDARCLRPSFYERVGDVAHMFDAVMTHDAGLLARGAPFVRTVRGGSWVPPDQWCLPPKTKNVAMILSEKAALPGHALRHVVANAGLSIDRYGPAYTPIGHDKARAYHDYRYAVVIEACQEENWFTEHLVDALAFGCVPIYWGCPNIGEWLNSGRIPKIASVSGLADWMRQWATPENYLMLQESTYRLQQQARAYAITEDWQVANCLRPFVEALAC